MQDTIPRRLAAALAVCLAFGLLAAAGCSPEVPAPGMPELPDTDIYVARAGQGADGLWVGEPQNVTRRPGYDNQPSFLPGGDGFLYTAIRDDMQADTWHYDLQSRSLRRVTASLESEFSPTVMPGGQGFSTVRAEPDGIVRLWGWPMDGRSPRVLLRDITGVAFHAWIDEDTVALAIARGGDELILEVVEVPSGRERVLARGIGRCLHPFPGGRNIAYVDKANPEAWTIRVLDLESGAFLRTIPTRPGAEDFVVLPGGEIVMAEGRRLFRHAPGSDDWTLLADWSERLEGRITRLAASPDGQKLALVVRGS